jgi:hypothetical protein
MTFSSNTMLKYDEAQSFTMLKFVEKTKYGNDSGRKQER